MASSARVCWVIADYHTNLGDTLIAMYFVLFFFFFSLFSGVFFSSSFFLFLLPLKKLKRMLFIMSEFVFCHHNFNNVLFNLMLVKETYGSHSSGFSRQILLVSI